MGFFTDKEFEIGTRLSKANRDAGTVFIKLLTCLKENENKVKSNDKFLRGLLGDFREMVGQFNDGYRYCVDMYNQNYCACGIRKCPYKSKHTLECQPRRHYSSSTTTVISSDYEQDIDDYNRGGPMGMYRMWD